MKSPTSLAEYNTTLHEFVGSLREACRHLWPAERWERFAILALILLAAVLRCRFVTEPIRFDEASNALYYSDRSILHALFGSAGNENHALNSLLVWFSVRLFGWSEVTVRLPALLCGLAFVWSQYGFMRWRLGKPRLSLLGSGVAATSPWLVYFSVNGRGYMGQAVILTALLATLLSAFRETRPERIRALGIWFGVLAVGGAWFVRSMIMFVPAVLIAFLALLWVEASPGCSYTRPSLRLLRSAAIASIVFGLIAFGPRLAYTGAASVASVVGSNEHQPTREALWTTVENLAGVPLLIFTGSREGRWSLFFIGGALLVGLWQGWSRGSMLFASLLALLLCASVVTLVLGFGCPSRVFLPASAFFLPIFASGFLPLERLNQRTLVAIVFVGAVVIYPWYWITHDVFYRIRDTGSIPQARDIAEMFLGYDGISRSLIVTPPLIDNGVAFYFRKAGVSQHTFASGYFKLRENSRPCELRQAIAYSPDAANPGRNAGKAFERFTSQPWYSRLDLNEASTALIKPGLGALIRAPFRECAQKATTRQPELAAGGLQ